MTFSEAVEPRFATVSVTDPQANQETDGRPARAETDPNTLVTPLKADLPQGWYLVYWRVISADGHPVKGAFTFAVGPNPGPAPQFVIPSLTESAATPGLLIVRWISYLTAMCAIGLLLLRVFLVRDVPRRVPGASLRSLTIAFWIAIGAALVATPIYDVMSTAKFAQRSAFDLGDVVPLLSSSHFGKALLDFEIVLALLALAGDDRDLAGHTRAAGAFRRRPAGADRRADRGRQRALRPGLRRPRGADQSALALHRARLGAPPRRLLLDRRAGRPARPGLEARHLKVPALTIAVPRFSRLAFVSVMVLVASGIGSALQHFPTLGSLWDTSYGKALVLKLIFLAGTIAIASVNFTRTAPRFVRVARGDPGAGSSAAGLLRILVSGEVLLVAGAIFGAALLTSLAPPPKALAGLGEINAHVNKGGSATVEKNGYELHFRFTPNRAAVPNTFAVTVTKNGKPVRGADVTAKFTMLDMEMQQQAYNLQERGPGSYSRTNTPALVMVGRWGVGFDIRPPGGDPLDVLLLDHAVG